MIRSDPDQGHSNFLLRRTQKRFYQARGFDLTDTFHFQLIYGLLWFLSTIYLYIIRIGRGRWPRFHFRSAQLVTGRALVWSSASRILGVLRAATSSCLGTFLLTPLTGWSDLGVWRHSALWVATACDQEALKAFCSQPSLKVQQSVKSSSNHREANGWKYILMKWDHVLV